MGAVAFKGSRELVASFAYLGNRMGASTFGVVYQKLLDVGQQYTRLDAARSLRVRREQGCRIGQCYANCQRIAVCDAVEGLLYCEGYAASSKGIPVAHAWFVDDAGTVVDPTWVRSRKSLVKGGEVDYFGVMIPKAFVQSWLLKRRVYADLLGAYIYSISQGDV